MASVPNFSLSVLDRKIAFSTLVQYAGKGAQILVSVVTLKIIANFLSAQEFGLYASISEFALFFSVAANLGIFANTIRQMADDPHSAHTFVNALVLRMITAAAFFALAVGWLFLQGAEEAFVVGAALFLAALFFDYITSVCDAMLQACYRMGRATVALVIGRVLFLGIILLLTQTPASELSFSPAFLVFGATLAGSVLTAGVSLFFVSRFLQGKFSWDRQLLRVLLLSSLPFGIINVLNSLYFRFLPDYFAHSILNDAQFSGFNVSLRAAQVVSLFSTFLMFSVLPGFKQYVDEGHWQKVQKLYGQIWKILLAAGAALVLFGSLFGQTVIELLTHKKFFLPELWFLFPGLLLLAAISYGYDLILLTLFALENDRWLLTREVMAVTLSLLFFWGSFSFSDAPAQIGMILAGALAAESFMVVCGSVRIRKLLAAHRVELPEN